MKGRSISPPNINATPVQYDIQRIRSFAPKSGHLVFGGGMIQYTWEGCGSMKFLDDEITNNTLAHYELTIFLPSGKQH